jgi:hypothetical protein
VFRLNSNQKSAQRPRPSPVVIQQLEDRKLLAANLLVNGNFSRGDTGFTTGLIYNRKSVLAEGTCVVGTDPLKYHPVGPDVYDHTTGTGNMLIVNGATHAGVKIWRETVKVTPGVAYSFSAWGTSWGGIDNYDISPAIPQVSVNGQVIGCITLPAPDGDWTPLTGTWLAKSDTATITLTDLNTSAGGNDSAYDDFVFSPLASIRGSVVAPASTNPNNHKLKPVAGVTVYLDTNGDGILDAGDITTITAKSGAYAFTGLPAGTFQVCQAIAPTIHLQPGTLKVTVATGKQAAHQNVLDTPVVPSAVISSVG